MQTASSSEAADVPLKRGFPDAPSASAAPRNTLMAPARRRFRLALRIGLVLAGLLTAGLLLWADGVDAKSEAFRGFVFEAEKAVFMESDDGDIYVLKGKGLEKYYDKYVEVGGESRINALGENELTVKSVKVMAAPGTAMSEDQPAKQPEKGKKP